MMHYKKGAVNMKVLLHGFGAMGNMVLEEAKKKENIEITGIIDAQLDPFSTALPVYRLPQEAPAADIVIDFSHPSLLKNLLEYGKKHQVRLVLATTGYSDSDLEMIREASSEVAIFQSYNMSQGIRMVLDALRVLAPQAGSLYDIEIEERHHRKKIDAPSGTAWLLFRTLARLLPGKKAMLDRSGVKEARKPEEIGMVALRGGTIFGEHTVLFAGEDELIEIKHTALSKRLFATGSLSAAEFLLDKNSGYYNLDNMI